MRIIGRLLIDAGIAVLIALLLSAITPMPFWLCLIIGVVVVLIVEIIIATGGQGWADMDWPDFDLGFSSSDWGNSGHHDGHSWFDGFGSDD